MAVVFISPKHKQKMFIFGITISVVVLLVLVSLWSFLSAPSSEKTRAIFNKPKISLNLSILDDQRFKELSPYTKIPLQFKYTARYKKGKQVQGLISGFSEEEVSELLEKNSGLVVLDLEEVGLGRENPFVPYASLLSQQTTKK